jgi:hypothetical protein
MTDVTMEPADAPAMADGEPVRAPTAPARPRSGALLLAGPILLGLLIATVTLLLVLQFREYTLAEATRQQQHQALVLADQAERAFEAVELVQSLLEDRLRLAAIGTPTEFRQRLSTESVGAELRSSGARFRNSRRDETTCAAERPRHLAERG